MTNRASHGFSMALIEIDGLPINNMMDLSMAIAVSHYQRVETSCSLKMTTFPGDSVGSGKQRKHR